MASEYCDIESLKSGAQTTCKERSTLFRSTTDGAFSVAPDKFEKIYLVPQNRVKGNPRSTFANPSPLTLLGLCMSLTCISCDLMGWGGSGGGGAATIGTYLFVGGLLMVIAGIFECLLGNTFPFVVSCGFGGFWFTMGSTLSPGFGSYAAYTPELNTPTLGLTAPGFLASFAFFFLCMAVFSFICLVCTLRTNIAQVIIFLFLTIQYSILASANWIQADGDVDRANRINVAGGAAGFVVISAGWYLFAAQMLMAVDFPIVLPVGDLSRLIRGGSQTKFIDGENCQHVEV
ncbi:hypothetical protein V500_00016 [Pseudogymnoascus sp. VKM F-4518 (FW-2643)]|nr:hypothetical protein V500_00016 [Pseudogymnoascus sp. VKM F-4518 (FW-2643)]